MSTTQETERDETGEQLAENIVRNKAKRYQEIQRQFANDEMSDERFEEELDQLMESGEDFMDYDINAAKKQESRRETMDELLFRAKEAGQIVGFGALVVLIGLAIIFTKGKLLVPLMILAVVSYFVYVLYRY